MVRKDGPCFSTRAALSVAECAALLRRCGSAKHLVEGRRIHQVLCENGQDRDTFLGNLLVQMYGSCGSSAEAYEAFARISRRNIFSWNIMISAFAQTGMLRQARILFQEMPERDQVSWNAMIAALAGSGDVDQVLQVLAEMEKHGIGPNRLTFVSLLDAFGNSGVDPSSLLEEGKLVHCKISQHGFHSDLQIQTALIIMYDRCGSVENAIVLFYQMRDPDVIAYNSLLSAFSRNGHLEETNLLFEQMPERNLASWSIAIAANLHCGSPGIALWLFRVMDLEGGHAADKTIYITLLYACGVVENLKLGEIVHAEIIADGLETDVFVGTALISMYGRCHCIDLARGAFEKIQDKNQVAWNAMITAYTQNENFDQARLLFDIMPESDVVSLTLMVTEFARNGFVEEAREMFDRFAFRDTAIWNAMIQAHAENGETSSSLKLLAQMDIEGHDVDRATFIGILSGNLSESEAKLLQNLIFASEFHSDCAVATAIVRMHGRSARLSAARETFEATCEKNVVLWSAAIGAYTQNGHFDTARRLLSRMNLEGVDPNDVTFVSILSACAHAGHLSNGREQFFAVQRDFGVSISQDHYMCMADLLARSGLVDEARELVSCMPFAPNSCSWKTLLAGCRVDGNLRQAKEVAGRAFDCEPEDSATYVILLNVLSNYD